VTEPLYEIVYDYFLISNYTILNFTDTFYLIYTTNGTDSLPVTKTAIENQPCLNSNEVSDNGGPVYRLEANYYDLSFNCTTNVLFDRLDDDRYKDAGLSMTEYDMQIENGVYENLTSLALYDFYVPEAEERKKSKVRKFWTRNTLSWALECEDAVGENWAPEEGKSRSMAL